MEILDFIIRGRSVLAQDIAALYGGESGVSTLRFTGADASKSYKLDLLNEWNGQKNVLDLQNDGGTLSVALTGAASIPAGGYQMQLRTVGETVWHSDPVRLTVRTPIDAVEAFDPNVPSEMRQLEQRATEAAQTAASVRDMTVSAETLPAGSAAGVEKTLTDGALHLTFSVPRGADGATPDISGKMDKSNPTGTGALSVNRLSGSTNGD
ncbi:MAG: hypothetical protein IJT18_07980 [Oscillospiraceae bacterium]|nr:hypothetical protein [Oscillospiraceae bacterium]